MLAKIIVALLFGGAVALIWRLVRTEWRENTRIIHSSADHEPQYLPLYIAPCGCEWAHGKLDRRCTQHSQEPII